MSDIVDTSPLGLERTERIAGDDALNSKLDTVTTELQGTQESVTTEVLHRSEGDLVIQRILEGYIQDLLEGKSEDFERYIEFQNSQNLNYTDVRNFVSDIRTSLAEEIRNLSTNLMDNLQANDARYSKLVSDVDRYIEILSDITLDSNQITLDNGELRAGAWTILSQARQWDLDIISRLNGLSASVGDSLKDAVEEIQNQLPSTEETITKAIEELSKSPFIKELSDELSAAIVDVTALDVALLKEQADRQRELSELAVQQAQALADEKALLLVKLTAESQERVDALQREAAIRQQQLLNEAEIRQQEFIAEAEIRQQALLDEAEIRQQALLAEAVERSAEVSAEVVARRAAIDQLAEDMLTRVDLDKAGFQSDILTVTNRIKSAEDGLTYEIQHRKDGDTSTLNALNTYKVSNDTAFTGLSTSLSNNVTKTNANTTLITGLSSRIDTAEDGIESATTAAADAMSKATTAVSANSALATRVDALAASLTESDGTVVDVNAFNALKAEVNTVKGTVTGLVEDVTALETNYTSVNNKVASQGTAISTLNSKMSTAENSISQSANDITLLKTDITSINSSLLTKVDSQAFSQLSSDVTELDGKYTTQAGLVTDLRGSLDTTNANVSNAATAAQNAMNAAGTKGKVIFGTTAPVAADRLSQNLWIDTTGNANTPKRWNGSAWVVVTDKVATDALAAANAATTLANTKADASAFNSLDQKVTVMDGKVSTNTNSITSLNGKIAIVEGGLATKLDSSAIVNYYTKQQTDDKALSTAAGEISKYDASLVIGGVNQLLGSEGERTSTAASSREYLLYERNSHLKQFYEDNLGKDITVSFEILVPVAGAVQVYSSNNSAHAFNVTTPWLAVDTWTKVAVTTKPTRKSDYTTQVSSTLEFYGTYGTGCIPTVRKVQLEAGNKATDWSPSPRDTQAALDANSTAIQNTNAEVTRVDGLVTAANSATTALAGRVSTVEGAVSTKAEASALTALTTRVTNAEGVNTSQGSAITSIQNTINHSTTGLASKASSAALTTVDNKVTAANGRIDTTNSNLTALTGRVDTVEGAVSTKADASALTSLSTRVTNAEGVNTSQGTAITTLQNTVNHATTGLSTKASTSALTATNSEVSRVNGVVTGHTNQLTQLTSDITAINGTLATKANASALNDIYTKTQTDAKALEISAGEVNKYDASLSIGMDNLLPTQIELWENGYWATSSGAAVSDPAYSRTKAEIKIPVIAGEKYSLRSNTRTVFVFYSAENTRTGIHESGLGAPPTAAQVITIPANTTYARVYLFGDNGTMAKPVPFNQAALTALQGMIVRGEHTKLVWQPSSLGSSSQINANASAIQVTNSEVTRINGVVTSQASSISNLQSGLSATDTKANTAINNAATAQQTANTSVTAGQSNASNLSKLESTFESTRDSDSLAADYLMKDVNQWQSHYGYDLSSYFTTVTDGKTSNTVFRKPANIGPCWNYSKSPVSNTRKYKLSMWVRCDASSLGACHFTAMWANATYPIFSNARYTSRGLAAVPKTNVWTKLETVWDLTTADYTQLRFGFAIGHATAGGLWEMQGFKVEAVIADSDIDSTIATATALQAVDTRVTNVDGKVTTNSNSITSLNSRMSTAEGNISTKANSTALNDYYTKTEADTKATTIAAGEVSKYDASLFIGGTNLISESNKFLVGGGGTGITKEVLTDGSLKLSGAGNTYHTFTTSKTQNSPTSMLKTGDKFTVTFWVRAVDTANLPTAMPSLYLSGPHPSYLNDFTTIGDLANGGAVRYVQVRTCSRSSTVLGNTYMHWAAGTLGGGLIIEKWQIEVGTKSSDWSPGVSDTQDQIDANATAIETTNAEVSRVDGRVTTESNRITSLTGRVSTVEGAVSTKAEASALNSLTTRVATEEGKSTSQGSAITALQNTINHATTGLSTKASSAALTAVDNKVTAVDGRVTATNSNVTSLTGRVSTVEGNLTTKADVSAVNALTTRVGNVEGGLSTQASDITSLKSSIAGTAESITANGSQATVSTIGLPTANVLLSANASSMTGSLIKLKGQVHATVTNSKMLIDPTKLYKLRMRYRRTAGATNYIYIAVINYNATGDQTVTVSNVLNAVGTPINNAIYPISYELPALNLWREVEYYFKGKSTGASTGTGTLASPRTFPALAATADIGVLANYNKGNDLTQEYEIDYLIFEDATNEAANNVNASAITSTNTEVARVNGVVSGHTTQLSNLNASIAGKADSSALNALTVRVADEEGKSSSQSTSITNLNSSVVDALKAVTVSDTRSTNQPPSWYWSNYTRRVVNEFKTQTVIGVGGFFGGTYCNLETKVYYSDPSGGDIIQTATSSVDPSLYVQRRSNGTAAWTAWAQPIKDLRDSLDNKASASAVSTLDTKVTSIDGRVTTQASQLTVLTSDNNNNKNALSVQGKVIDGVKANYMVKMETNGVIGGFGIIQEATGAMGTVTTTFGVNANNFFIGAPASNKKPFIVTTTNQVVNGVTYPAGTYIDVALIANATIGTAKIADLAVTNAKILDATIESAKIKSIKADKIEIGNPLVGPITSAMVTGTSLTNAANLFNGTIAANAAFATYGTGTQSATSGAETNYIQVDVGSTVSMPEVRFFFRGSAGRKTYIKLKASVDGVNWDYVMGSAAKWETIDDMPPGPGSDYSIVTNQASFSWYGVKPYRYLRIYGNGSSASATNELVAIIGNASGSVTKIGSEGILTNSITADKINVTSLSAISANLGTIQVGSANIDNGAITTAKIGDLQVDTLKIKDNAVTVPSHFTDFSTLASTSIAQNGTLILGSVQLTGVEAGQSVLVFCQAAPKADGTGGGIGASSTNIFGYLELAIYQNETKVRILTKVGSTVEYQQVYVDDGAAGYYVTQPYDVPAKVALSFYATPLLIVAAVANPTISIRALATGSSATGFKTGATAIISLGVKK